jgi:hypothetical protein
VIAKVVAHLWDSVERIDVVYICSNGDIARQNINRLRIPGASEFTMASRVTMLPVQVQDLKNSRLNFVSLTPGTSFDPKSKLGMWRERVLLYHLLKDVWKLRGAASLNLFAGHMKAEAFRAEVAAFAGNRTIDADLAARFHAAIASHDGLRVRYEALLEHFSRDRKTRRPREVLEERASLVGEVRACLAATCIQALEPDLIILDEFQRFRDLLDGDNESGQLARNLFEWSHGHQQARVLLLSATPYKMYTLSEESASDDHYRDFLRTARFLVSHSDGQGELAEILRRYRDDLYQLGDGNSAPLRQTKAELEGWLRRVMVRTERLAVTSDRDGMLRDATLGGLELEASDIAAYRALHAISDAVHYGDPTEFWKSAPYLLSFMEDYKLKKDLESQQVHPPSAQAIAAILRSSGALSITRSDVERYAQIDPQNARLRWLLHDTVERGAWRLLWVPASLPYYAPAGVWADQGLERFTKRLVFSSWRVVPRMIAAMASYSAERAAVASMTAERLTWSTLRERLRGPLRFNVRDGQPAGMAAMTLLYPSSVLAELGDPLRGAAGADRSIDALREGARVAIEQLLAPFVGRGSSGAEDERWYWAAPVLLDLQRDSEATRMLLEQQELASFWCGGELEEDDTGWERHVGLVTDLATGDHGLGRPPSDLAALLADLAIGAPGVVALRALSRVADPASQADRVIVRREAARVAWAARNLFNLPECIAVLRGINPAEPYWRRVVEYCIAGNLQAVLDEYAHVLLESQGLQDASRRRVATEVAEQMRSAMTLRTSNPGFDEVVATERGFQVTPHRIRARFALRFGDERSETDDKVAMRGDQVRQAFNSPFWPFILATTSIGQEGLDFHPYCHAVVHWNLPSNPVDLEQREGRVHRYKGHAVRKTIATNQRAQARADAGSDPWSLMFDAAAASRPEGSELTPYWVHGEPDGCRIERHVPVLPLSREILQFDRLRRSLAVYRMVFGQPRQDDLIAYLTERMSVETARAELDAVRIDLQPPPLSRAARAVARPAKRRSTLVTPTGELGRRLFEVLDRYALLLEGERIRAYHPAVGALSSVADHLTSLDLPAAGDQTTWAIDWQDPGDSWRLPKVWLDDQRRGRTARDDLRPEIVLDPDREGVYVAASCVWTDWGQEVPLAVAHAYREARRRTLIGVFEPVIGHGFEPIPAGQFLHAPDQDYTDGVALWARFFNRAALTEDEAILEALRQVLPCCEAARQQRVAAPSRDDRRLVR